MSTQKMKQLIYEGLANGTNLSFKEVLYIFLMACVIGIFIYAVYRYASKAAFYSKDTALTIAGLPIVIAAIMIAMQSNFIISLGMVGALSIVRFRSAIKNPLDILYLFWSMSGGIICGVGLPYLALLLCAVMGLFILLLGFIPNTKASSILVIKTSKQSIDYAELTALLKKYAKYYKEKSHSVRNQETELIYELQIKDGNGLVKELGEKFSFEQINFLSHDGQLRV